jgi:hypothetical protein
VASKGSPLSEGLCCTVDESMAGHLGVWPVVWLWGPNMHLLCWGAPWRRQSLCESTQHLHCGKQLH